MPCPCAKMNSGTDPKIPHLKVNETTACQENEICNNIEDDGKDNRHHLFLWFSDDEDLLKKEPATKENLCLQIDGNHEQFERDLYLFIGNHLR